ncbi:peptidase M24 [Nibricoccus aquaticus]|uniref:Peptidase M24 n=1 Tax=Nibricoccus aquaticus TaxID=2576891 RepID=A0A290Q2E0_9BACT|nr:Xaa-Pro peptidase family protein [Nibricoccus aquaticus]ATC62815.1 peptidase M24 [Nibricoccus aquaticus]
MPTPAILLYADSHNADVLYFGRVHVPDAFIAIAHGKKKIAVINALEFGRVKKSSAFTDVLPLEKYLAAAREKAPGQKVGAAEVIALVAREFGIKTFVIPEDFPAGLANRLTGLDVTLELADGPIFPAREIKTSDEAAAIREGNRCSALGIAAAEAVLRASKIVSGKLHYRGASLTSERLKFAIETACLEAGALSIDTIAAGGDQACDPHDRGSGPLRAHELIIVDVFPRVQATGYHGDMTRTFLKGRASDAQRSLVAAVREAQKAALKKIRAGINGRTVHQQCLDVFAKRGYETKRTDHGSVGFFHGTGHGLGLAIHETPRVSTVDYKLKAGSVVTVEPGLYYPGLGGCRIEDVVQVTSTGAKLLSSAPYDWELK